METSLNTQAVKAVESYCIANNLGITGAVRENWISQWAECKAKGDYIAIDILMEENRLEALAGGEVLFYYGSDEEPENDDDCYFAPVFDPSFNALPF